MVLLLALPHRRRRLHPYRRTCHRHRRHHRHLLEVVVVSDCVIGSVDVSAESRGVALYGRVGRGDVKVGLLQK